MGTISLGLAQLKKGELLLEVGKMYYIKAEFGTDPTFTFDRPGANGFGAGGI